ncbi:FAD-dependent oxidoreductase [Actinosynnema sp. NPDC047251]|uniref:Amine oxidase n=1 Tax=Saccharothrix espanaensis (strain ATCC 51144 / DSM 44229 / JCM 9112 / NBRC 15066 / NRRL 15764) TaxID=1179773 RepID=K0K7M6_SACES|nr:FAD-dependent oxidoreductase [Saccharothrix espanaensis]CCH32598.1 Amine oxidase [Saccharothrix espanaensis DSM 44229]
MRVGIVGAGISGLVTAWLVDQECTAVLLEARSRIGGNARSAAGCVENVLGVFDLGTQEIAADDSSAHAALMAAVGIDAHQLIDVPSSHTFSMDGNALLVDDCPGRPAHVGRGPLWEQTRSFLDSVPDLPDRDVPFGAVVESLSPPPAVRDHVLSALPAALFACPVAQVVGLPAHVVLTYLSSVANDEPSTVRVLRGGMESLAWALAARLTTTEVRTGAGVDRVERTADGYALIDTEGHHRVVEQLVLTVPPPTAARLLPASMTGPGAPWHVLRRFAYRPVRYALHLDPAYLPGDRDLWSTYNLISHDGWAESSFWYGPSHGVDVFKSQITHRSAQPRRVLATSTFHALTPTTDLVDAQRALAALQGREGLHFAGHYTTGLGDQESAIASAAAVARRITPGSARLRHLPAP